MTFRNYPRRTTSRDRWFRQQLRLEPLEHRLAPAAFTVLNTADAGAGSLRQAIIDVNTNPGADLIDFNIAPGGAQTVSPATALPFITDSVTIDGTTQPGFTGSPIIELEGSSAIGGGNGLVVANAPNCVIQGLVINRWSFDGIHIFGGGALATAVTGNNLGTNAAGTHARPNGGSGIVVASGARFTRIGTNGDGVADAAEGNLISANNVSGIGIYGNDTWAAGNLIGTDLTGTSAIGNRISGISVASTFFGTNNTRLGTNSDGLADSTERNVISGNGGSPGFGFGIDIASPGVIAGNLIGTDISGTSPLGNASHGIRVQESGGIRIGTNGDGAADLAERNIVSGNGGNGILIEQNASAMVAGNYIGTNMSGSAVIGNAISGVAIDRTVNNVIGGPGAAFRNVISGQGEVGVTVFGATASNNRVQGNYIGTNATGTAALPNAKFGVALSEAAHHNTIGTDGDGVFDTLEANVVSGNVLEGIFIIHTGTDHNVIAGNLIGLDVSGTSALPNSVNADGAIRIFGGASYNRIGTNADGIGDAAERNIISGNVRNGIQISDGGTSFNVIAGNYIGTNASGTAAVSNGRDGVAVANATFNLVGTNGDAVNDAAEGNLISGNGANGVILFSAHNNAVAGNVIGTDVSLTLDLGNGQGGVSVGGNGSNNRIGTDGNGVADAADGGRMGAWLSSGHHFESLLRFVGRITERVCLVRRIGGRTSSPGWTA